jgi:parallel beta-helix repeat protein
MTSYKLWQKAFVLSVGVLLVGACLGLAGSPSPAAAQLSCPVLIGPNQTFTLQQDLVCPSGVGPALNITGPATVNLNGHRIICQNGNDGLPGITLLGERAQVRNGTVVDCFVGVTIAGIGDHRIEQVATQNTCDSGFVVAGAHNNILTKNIANQAGRNFDPSCTAPRIFGINGFTLNGNDNRLTNNTATHNVGEGFLMNGDNNQLTENTAANNNFDGFELTDDASENRLSRNLASNNGNGFQIRGNRHSVRRNTAISNRLDGFVVMNSLNDNATQTQLSQNLAIANGGIGFDVQTDENQIQQNQALSNGNIGIQVNLAGQNNLIRQNAARQNDEADLDDRNPDCDNNQWRQNTFLTSTAGNVPNPPCIQ